MLDNSNDFSRRSVLQASGAAIVGGLAATTTATADEEEADEVYDDFQFDTVINAVEAGADPTGGEDIGPLLEEYAEDNTLIWFPEGEYKLDQFRNNEGPWDKFSADGYYPLNDFGIRGAGSDKTSFVVPEGRGTELGLGFEWEKLLFEIRYGTNILFEGIRLDNTAPNTGGRFQINANDGLVVRDVHVDGKFQSDMTCLSFAVYNEGGEGLVENVRAPDGSINEWENFAGSVGMYIPSGHSGTLTVRNCHVEGFQDNGLYASSPTDPAAIQVEGGYWANNNISQVRLGQSRSYVKNATVAVTERIDTEYVTNMRGIRQQDGEGMVAKNCNIIHTADAPSNGAIITASRTGEMTVKNCHIHVGDPGTTHAIAAASPWGSDYDGNPIDTESVTIKNVSITGTATTGSAIEITDRDGNEIKNVCIDEESEGRDGIAFTRSSGSVQNAAIDVEDEEIVVTGDDAEVETRNVRDNANCTGPKLQ